jgi:hypothetical protein
MNANELAQSIATCEPNLGRIATDCADMLRQQQAEKNNAIETLKYLLEVAQEDYKTMNSHFVIEKVNQALKELGNE